MQKSAKLLLYFLKIINHYSKVFLPVSIVIPNLSLMS